MGDVRLRVICGPTAAGKSSLAVALAAHFPLAVVSADSRQVYRGFDIGTAKPTMDERRRVRHYGIDVVDPTERYSAAAWAAAAHAWIGEASTRGAVPVIVGGTGFYLRAVADPLFHEPPLDRARRDALQRYLGARPTSELARWVRALDPGRLHGGRTQLLRAIEVALLTGIPITEWHRRSAGGPALALRYLVVDPGPALPVRIAHRVAIMLARGWKEETERLVACVPAAAPAWSATGYATMRRYVRGELSRRAVIERITLDTRRYAKRQRTWFRHQLPPAAVTPLDPTRPDALERAAAWWLEGDEP